MKTTTYDRLKAKAKKWDKLMEFMAFPNHITDTIVADYDGSMIPPRRLRMTKDKKLHRREKTKKPITMLDFI